ncbi:class I SAM-dependent methyltransferase [Roseateles amylovorans]|uniref:Class I SAM-dependent methyltransferase n=1 Tax=Roseateles amylovorans TaxID=2978473 RepID=A0ABY6B952_9BURK|nr:class I SAM-dependent methyltransferase [Roseateles amylovorans]UXH80920.1 class I SAM-dependent methyltransferase [Roseateles amylovorans]
MRWLPAWRDQPDATALDLACGSGRHLIPLAEAGLRVTGVDRDAAALTGLRARLPASELIEADIEAGPWPLGDRVFDLVVVTNYLWRPLFPNIADAVAPGGWLIYETFTDGQQHIGRPSRPEFLLRPGELLTAFGGLRIVAFEDGFTGGAGLAASGARGADGSAPPSPGGVNGRYVQRVAAVREQTPRPGVFPRYRLD